MKGFTEGRIVHFVLPDGEHRPAIIVRAWPDGTGCEGYANLQVFTDGSNDLNAFAPDGHLKSDIADSVREGRYWAGSVCFDEETKAPRTWHWIEPA